jgi:uncharacterized protein (TIGR03546 family)
MFTLKILKKIVMILQSDVSPKQVALGAAFGAIVGLSPFFCLHNILIFLIILLFKVNLGSAILSIGFFGIIGLFTDPFADKIGQYLLINSQGLTSFWTNLYNMPIIPFTKFYNTVVLGSFVIALILFIPIYFVSLKLLVYYRAHWRDKVAQWKIRKWFKVGAAYNVYDKYQ